MKRRPSVAIAAVLLASSLAACSSTGQSSSSTSGTAAAVKPVTVTVGVTDASKDYWKTFVDLAAKQGITVKLQNFTDYQQPNPILSQGGLELNQFQHLLFLANYNVKAKADLVPIGATAVYQLGLYTTKGYKDPSAIPAGGKIAIPNDPTNQARALLVLQSAGLISLKDGGSAFSTPADVQPGSKVTVVPVDANQTPVQEKTLDGAIINNNFASDAGIDPTTAIYSDLKDLKAAEPYINVWVARAKDKDNPTFAKLVQIYRSPEVTRLLLADSKGTAVSVDKTPAELQTILTKLQDQIKAS